MRFFLLFLLFLSNTNPYAQQLQAPVQTAHNTHNGKTGNKTVDSNETVFPANGDSGLSAYNDSGYTDIANQILKIPVKYQLLQNYHSSYNPGTTIKFTLPRAEIVSPKIYNLLGQVVATLVSEKLTPGNYKCTWDASGFASGVYYYRIAIHSDKIKSGSFVQTKKLLLIK